MRIACLAWGSLIWKPEPLVLASAWRADGPLLPIELARESDGGELATVLCADARNSEASWALLAVSTMAEAREALREREQIPTDRLDAVGSLPRDAGSGPFDAVIADWARTHGLDGVVWTALPPRSKGIEGRMPSVDEAVDYLAGLQGGTREHAEDYVRRIPTSIRTPYRAAIEARLGWTQEPEDATAAG